MNMHDFTHGAVVHNRTYANPVELTQDAMRRMAPSIFAEHAQEDVSGRYLFLPTFEILEKLMQETALVPVRVREQNVRTENRVFARHEITLRMREEARDWKVGDTVFECRLTNSHNRASAYALDPGLFRFACSNGLLLPDSVLPGVRIRHTGDADMVGRIIEGTCELVRESPALQQNIEQMRALTLTQPEQQAFAHAAALLRWDEDKIPVKPETLLNARRPDDRGDDQWRVLNRVQENVIKGGQRGFKCEDAKVRRVRSRSVESITENQRINKALWTLAAEMQKLKAA